MVFVIAVLGEVISTRDTEARALAVTICRADRETVFCIVQPVKTTLVIAFAGEIACRDD